MFSIITGAITLLSGWVIFANGNFELGVMLAVTGIGIWICEIGHQTCKK